MAHYELIVIGAGPGGYEAALHAAKLGKKVAVVEKREAGGTCLNRGCIPTKTLLHSSQIFHDAKHGAHAGIHTDDIRADMTEIFAYKREISQKLSSGIESLFKTAKIDFLRGTALITAPGAVRVTDAEGGANDYTCDDILIATGSVPSRPPIPGLEFAMTSDELLEGCDHLYRSIVIIGGGVIGRLVAGGGSCGGRLFFTAQPARHAAGFQRIRSILVTDECQGKSQGNKGKNIQKGIGALLGVLFKFFCRKGSGRNGSRGGSRIQADGGLRKLRGSHPCTGRSQGNGRGRCCGSHRSGGGAKGNRLQAAAKLDPSSQAGRAERNGRSGSCGRSSRRGCSGHGRRGRRYGRLGYGRRCRSRRRSGRRRSTARNGGGWWITHIGKNSCAER